MTSEALAKLFEEAEASGHLATAREVMRRRTALEPENPALLLGLADLEQSFCCFPEAEAAIDAAESLGYESMRKWIYMQRGHLQKAQGRFEEALASYLVAHELDPENASFLIYASVAMHAAGHAESAMEFAERSTHCVRGALEEAFYNLGAYHTAQGHYEKAADCFRRAVEIDPEFAVARQRLEDVQKVLGLPPES